MRSRGSWATRSWRGGWAKPACVPPPTTRGRSASTRSRRSSAAWRRSEILGDSRSLAVEVPQADNEHREDEYERYKPVRRSAERRRGARQLRVHQRVSALLHDRGERVGQQDARERVEALADGLERDDDH